MNCPQCKQPLQSMKYDLGHGVSVLSKHCTSCKFNVTPQDQLDAAMMKWRERTMKDVKVIAIGEGLGIRFPKELVHEYGIKKGTSLMAKGLSRARKEKMKSMERLMQNILM